MSGGKFVRMPDFKRLYARIDDEVRLLWEAQRSLPLPAVARPCHSENPFRGKGGFAYRGNNQDKKPNGAGAKSHSG